MPVSYISPRITADDDYGRPIVGGQLYTYVNRTTIPKPTYQDAAGTAANTNPVILDANGSAVLYLIGNEMYTFVLRDKDGVLLWTQDDILGQLDLDALDDAVADATAEAKGYAEDAKAEADRAEAAADAANLASGVYPSPEVIITGDANFPPLPNWHYATVPSQFEYGFLDLYQRADDVAQYVNTYPDRDAVILAISAIGLANSARWRCFYQYRGDRGGEDIVDVAGVVIGGTNVNIILWTESIYGPSRRCFYQYRGDKGGADVVDKYGTVTAGSSATQALILAGQSRCFYTGRGGAFESVEVDKFGTIIGGATVIQQIGSGGTTVASGLYIRKTNATQLSIYFKGSPGVNWIEVVLTHEVVAFNGDTARTNKDLWRIVEAFETDASFTRLYGGAEIVNGGEWECAIGIPGASDHVGGYHGFERQSLCYLLIEGVHVDIDTWTGAQRARSVDFVQVSEIYRHGTLNETLCTHFKHYEFGPSGFVLNQRVGWVQNVTISTAYLGMLPIVRRAINNDTGPLITDHARRTPIFSALDPASPIAPFTIEDISVIGTTEYRTTDTESVTIWGETSGISATMEFLDVTRTPSAQFRIATDRPQYNKLYNAPATEVPISAGDIWHADIRYTLNTIN